MTDDKALAIRQAIGVERLGEIMYKSGYWQDTRSQAQAIVKILAGAELDIGPIASMNGIYVIEGKTSMAATLVAAQIQRSERYRYKVVEHDDKHCVIDFFEIASGKREKLGTSSFAEAEAKAAGLLDRKGGMWTKYPRNMYFSRALTNGARWYTPDVFSGPVYTPDELGAEVNAEGNVVDVYVPPSAPDEPSTPTRERDPGDRQRTITSADDRLWKRWEAIRSEALKYGVVPPSLSLPIGYEQLVSNATMVKAQTEAKQAQLDREDAARAEHQASAHGADTTPEAAQEEPPEPSSPADPWVRNRELMAQVYEAGYKLRALPANTPLDEVELRNAELEQLLETAGAGA